MLKKLAIYTLYAMLLCSASTGLSQELDQESSLVFRFTGIEADKLISFMKERLRLETDFDQTRYYGDRMSLACSESRDCYVWLARKEWQSEAKSPAGFSVISFTLPVKQNTWSGRLAFSAARGEIQLELQDFYFPGTFSFTKPLSCLSKQGNAESTPLHGGGDCRLELSHPLKKGPPSTPSIQFIHNVDHIIVNFKGPWARKLFFSAGAGEIDPFNAQRRRVQIGPETYCWNLDPLEQDKFLNDAYVCQSNLKRQDGADVRFSNQGLLIDGKAYSLTLKPSFRNNLLHDFDLLLGMEGTVSTVTHCPSAGKSSGLAQCGLLYDMTVDAGRYPLGNSVQGVAVGWGVVKKDPDSER